MECLGGETEQRQDDEMAARTVSVVFQMARARTANVQLEAAGAFCGFAM
jgi:hypothetical protein